MSTGIDAEPGPPRSAWRRRRRLRTAVVGAAVVATVALAGTAALGLGGRDEDRPTRPRTGPAATTTVTRQSLAETVTLAGKLSYGGAVPLACTATGTVTWLPAAGTVVERGKVLLRVDEAPVVLLYGALPAYRDLAETAKGADVRQLEQNLSALGYRGFTVDQEFSATTTTAVKRWQKDLGLPETGTVERGRVIYAPGAVRIARQLVRLGGSATADVLSYTGNTRVVTVAANAGEAAWAVQGAKVTVALPGGTTVAGQVSGVSATEPAEAPPADNPASPGTGSAGVTVTIAVADQAALGQLDAVPVDVRHVTTERMDVLTVPVAALLALAEGGYGLEVVDAGGARVVAVSVGLFAGGRVEVSGPGIDAGTIVGVPA